MDTTRPTISAPPEQPKPDIAYMSELGRTGQVAKAVDEREARVLGDRRDRRPPVDTRTNTPVFASGRANAPTEPLSMSTPPKPRRAECAPGGWCSSSSRR